MKLMFIGFRKTGATGKIKNCSSVTIPIKLSQHPLAAFMIKHSLALFHQSRYTKPYNQHFGCTTLAAYQLIKAPFSMDTVYDELHRCYSSPKQLDDFSTYMPRKGYVSDMLEREECSSLYEEQLRRLYGSLVWTPKFNYASGETLVTYIGVK